MSVCSKKYRNLEEIPVLSARFIAVDPKAEDSESMTTYQYAGNNPVMLNDPMGDLIPTPGSHTPPPYMNVGEGNYNSLPADIQQSIDNFLDGGGGDGLYYTNPDAYWSGYYSTGGEFGGTNIYHTDIPPDNTGFLS